MFLSSLLVVVVMVVTVHTVSEYFIHHQEGVIIARAGEKVGRIICIVHTGNCELSNYKVHPYRKRLKLSV